MPIDFNQLIVGVVTLGIIELLKRINGVPLNAGQTARLRTAGVVLAFLGSFATSWSDGTLENNPAIQDGLILAAQTAASWFVAHGGFKLLVKPFSKVDKPV